MNIKTAILALGAASVAALPIAALAQPAPPSYASQDEQIRGTIASLGGKYTIYVRDERGYVDTVDLHDGTVINPTGLSLEPGQSVTIFGRTNGHAFDANEINTPYNEDDGGGGYAVGADAGYVSPYPYYSYYPAYALAYPAFISLGFGFGGGYYGGYYGGYGRGYYGGYGRGYGGAYGRGGYGYGRGGYAYGHVGYGSYNRGGSYGGYARSGAGYGRSSAGVARGGGSFGGGGSHGGGGGHR